MKTSVIASHRRVSSIVISLFMMAVSVVFGGASTCAQTESVRDGSTPSALTAGAPAGSYSLSGFESVNPFNGGLNFSLPLLSVGGRGGAAYTITLRIDQKWSIRKEINPGHSANYYPTPSWNDPDGVTFLQTYSVGKLTARHGASRDFFLVNACGYASRVTLTRLTFTAPDGTEYELRDAQTNGAPHVHSTTVCEPQYNRGKVFVTADGTSATFISDTDITDPSLGSDEGIPPGGVMILKDGTRFRIGNGGNVDWMRDRNGNLITFTYGFSGGGRVTTVTDPLGRQVTITEGSPVVIAYKGFGGADRAVKIYYGALSTALRSDFMPQTQNALFPGINNPAGTTTCNPVVISSVEMPDLRTYQFSYNSYGELARVVLPTGGAFEYDYAAGLTDGVASGMFSGSNNEKQVYRRITERRVYPSGGTGSAYTVKQTYSRPESSTTHSDVVEVKQCTSGPSAGACGTGTALLSRELHYYYGSPRLSFNKQPYEYTGWQEGKEYKTETYDPQSNALLRKVETTWQQPADGQTWPLTTPEANGSAKPNNPQVTAVMTTLADTNQVTAQTYAYDQYGNSTDTYEYDYGAGVIGPFVRRTHTDYATAAVYVNSDVNPALGAGLRGVPIETWVSSDGGGANKVSRASYVYDQYALTDPGVTGHDASYGAGFLTRGNLTGTTRYLNPTAPSGGVTTTATYDVAGNVTSATDALGRTSYVSYNDNFSDGNNGRGTYAFPTGTQSPVPDTTGQYGSAAALTTSTKYDFQTGSAFSSTDANGKTTTFDYTDPLDRIKSVTRPDGGWTSYEYGRNQWGDFVYTRVLLNATGATTYAYQYSDGLGRPYRAFSYDPTDVNNAWLTSDTQYDSMGRFWKVSNPYRSLGATGAVNPSNRWTTTAYDALGRVKSVTTPDGAAVTTGYSGNAVTVTDQQGKKRSSVSDALGRLTQVTEDPGGLNYVTTYAYDVLGKMRMVNQGGQLRYFMYDSLSRLVRVKNPEQAAGSVVSNMTDTVTGNSQWSTGYGYDDNGNMTVRIDARNVTTNYNYDALNRNTAVFYSDGTMSVGRAYDKTDNGVGRLSWDWRCRDSSDCISHNSYNYDAVGRVYNKNQYFWAGSGWSQPYMTFYAYDLAGNVTGMSYPSGHNVTYNYDAAGRLGDSGAGAAFYGNLGDGAQRTYSSQVRYAETGGMEQERFGTDTPVYNKHLFNSRGQLAEIRVSTYSITTAGHETDWNRGAIINHYSLAPGAWGATGGGPDNNGNLRKQDIYIPNDDAISGYSQSTQFYDYDALNRLYQARENSNVWVQYFDYDRWGNRTINAANTTGGVPEPQFAVDAATNRLGVPAGQTGVMSYDAAGNLTYDTYQGGGTRTYDAENRMTSAQFVSGQLQTALYAYDSDGRRVKRKAGAGAEVWMVYGVGGELLAEYGVNAPPAQPQKEYGYRSGELLVTADAPTGAQTNLALGKTATQSSIYSMAPSLDAGVAVDGVTSGGLTHTNLDAQAWWQVDLGAIQQIDTVKLWNRLDCCQDRLSNFYVFVSDSPFTSTDLNTTVNQPGVSSYYVAGQAPLTLSQAVGRTGRYVRVQLTGTNYLSLREVEVFGSPNLAAGKAATQSSTYPAPNIDASSAVDGNAGNITHTNLESRPWWQVDLGSVQSLNAVKLWNRPDCCQQRLSNFYILVSDTPFQSGDLNATLAQPGVTAYYVAGQAPAVLTQSIGRTGRYVRVQLNGSDYLSLAEVQVLGSGGGAADVRWLVADQLGTPRMVVDKSGSLSGVRRHDYLPFGEEIQAGVSGRATGQGYSADSNRFKFATYERDDETGLDYARARYYGSTIGRFTSPDPLISSGVTAAPQTWNRYSYVNNNPLASIDPSGLEAVNTHEAGHVLGEDEQRQPPPPRVIYIFVIFTPMEQQTQIYSGKGKNRKIVGTVAGPNFQRLVDSAPKGTTVRLLQGDAATKEAFTKALQDPNAAAVVFVGHGATDNPDTHATPFLPMGINFGTTEENKETFSEPVEVKAQNVAIFACNSQKISDLFQTGKGQSLTGMDSGKDGFTTTPALTHAGFAAARALIRGSGPDAAVIAANSAMTLNDNKGHPLNRTATDIGDSVRRLK